MNFPADVPVTYADVADLGRLVPNDAPHQGVVIEVAPLEDMWLADLLADAPEKAVLLVLDQVTDPHNVGAIMRSAAAFGAIGIVTQDRHSPTEGGVLAKAASGALERVPWARVVNLARALEEIAEAGFWRIGLAGDADDRAEGRARPAAGRAGARRRGAGHAPERARALRRGRAPADQRRGRKPQRVERRGDRALRRERRLTAHAWSAPPTSLNASLDALAAVEPGFARVLETHGRPEPRLSEPGVETLLRTIVGQQVSVAAARSMWAKLDRALRRAARSRAPCSRPSDEELRAAGLSRQKAGYARSLAGLVLSGELDLADLPADDEEAIALLTKIKGIGRWSAEIYLLFAEGRGDVWPAGDLAVQIEVGRLLGLDERPSEKQLRALAEAWRPHRGAAAVLAWHSYNSVGTAL